ncbi:MAG: helix-turn-helix transcriptional regulator [Candidatus Dormibacteraeota bacterium]|nr:helix-turn-helix transcriptional regulator [Candidatus Dormibacteraeota bacterium]
MSARRGPKVVTQKGDAEAAPVPNLTAFCPRYHQAVELIGKRWTGAILRLLITGPHRFNEILAGVPGLSDRLLSERMRELEGAELVVRRVFPGPPIRSEYDLTERGRELEPVVRDISAWADKWIELPTRLAEATEH